jgi:hypothetical protein
MKKLLFCFLLLGYAISSQGQTKLDSLVRRLASTPADTTRVRLLDRIAGKLNTADAAQSLRYGQAGLRLAQELHYEVGEVRLLNTVADTYFATEDLTNAARFYQQTIRRAHSLAQPRAKREHTMALLGLGQVAVLQHDYLESQRYFGQALSRM